MLFRSYSREPCHRRCSAGILGGQKSGAALNLPHGVGSNRVEFCSRWCIFAFAKYDNATPHPYRYWWQRRTFLAGGQRPTKSWRSFELPHRGAIATNHPDRYPRGTPTIFVPVDQSLSVPTAQSLPGSLEARCQWRTVGAELGQKIMPSGARSQIGRASCRERV